MTEPAGQPAALLPEHRMSLEFRQYLLGRCADGRLGPVLDLDALDRRYAIARQAAEAHGVELLCAVKASTDERVLAQAARHGLGFDVANQREWQHARRADPAAVISLTAPALPMAERQPLHRAFAAGQIQRWHCDSLGQLAELARACPGSELGVRVNLDGTPVPAGMPLWQPSRFGIRLSELGAAAELAAAHGCSLRWLHIHNGSEENDIPSYVYAAEQIVAAAAGWGLDLAGIDLGGGVLAEATVEALGELFGAVRRVVPASIRLIFEPGRFWLTDCISLVTQVLEVKESEHRIHLVLDLGLMNHLQWSDFLRLPRLAPLRPDDGRQWRICGRSCFEEDWLDESEVVPVAPDGSTPRIGDYLVLGNVSGYSIELSCDFNGIDRPVLEAVRPSVLAAVDQGFSPAAVDQGLSPAAVDQGFSQAAVD